MDKEFIERLAKVSGAEYVMPEGPADTGCLAFEDVGLGVSRSYPSLYRFAQLVAEECAKIADASDEYIGDRIRERFKA